MEIIKTINEKQYSSILIYSSFYKLLRRRAYAIRACAVCDIFIRFVKHKLADDDNMTNHTNGISSLDYKQFSNIIFIYDGNE